MAALMAAVREFAVLHGLLSPSAAEMAAFAGDYARMLPSAPPGIAGLAQQSLRAVDTAGLLDLSLLVEASSLVLLRTERGLVTKQLTWLETVARRDPSRAGEVSTVLSVAFEHPALDVREKAANLARRWGTDTPAQVVADPVPGLPPRGAAGSISRLVVSLKPSRPGRLSVEEQLFTLERVSVQRYDSHHWSPRPSVLAAALPHHREAVAAWALSSFAELADRDRRGGSALLPMLAAPHAGSRICWSSVPRSQPISRPPIRSPGSTRSPGWTRSPDARPAAG
ncbi:hypothetical protein FB565_000142 [Actinoplanes lutulentus]|uniref:Uncharacterized protein n=1 Tax=Actinoplanes lutulentus TaxID=1287878 RepID=A0A327YWK5_9ACTN|nr:hypothetical protein [Actinoplanes lutulentus]MBB2940438.1 hypothetical protein [Actinoplanes lutulentus]RAK25830.1 hypothetical protein B0I29_13039 [Actinoplanes lutulentus]